MSATPPAPAPDSRPRPAAAWLAFSATDDRAGRPGRRPRRPDRHRRPRRGPGCPGLLPPGQRRDRGQRRPPGVDPATADPANPADRERYPALWGATVHECAHAAHSRWRAPKGTDAAWSAAATALEESRIEARQVDPPPR